MNAKSYISVTTSEFVLIEHKYDLNFKCSMNKYQKTLSSFAYSDDYHTPWEH